MTDKIRTTILNTLQTNNKLENNLKYAEVMAYLPTNQNEICTEVLLKAIETSFDKKLEITTLLKDPNFCLNAAYEYVYFLSLDAKVKNASR